MTDEVRLALFAVIVGRGADSEAAWRIIDELPPGLALRDLAERALSAANEAAWNGYGGARG